MEPATAPHASDGSDVLDIIDVFGAAWNAHDLDAALAQCSDDIVFESTAPPDGVRSVGHAAVREAWAPIFDDPASRFDVEETILAGDRVVQRVRYSWGDGHISLVDVFRVTDGKIVEKLSYVKG